MDTNNKGFTLWFTGLSGAGKSTLARSIARELCDRGLKVEVLDGDVVRRCLSSGLGYTKEDRDTNIRRIGFVSDLLSKHGVVAIVAAISPYRDVRDEVRRNQSARFIEVFVDCPIDVLVQRDVKGLYKKALRGEVSHFTGISDPYEAPENPELHIRTDVQTLEQSIASILGWLTQEGHLKRHISVP